MLLKIIHATDLTYTDLISESVMELRMAPRQEMDQHRLSFDLAIGPETQVSTYFDWLGNTVHGFTISKFHSRIRIVATSVVETDRPRPEPERFKGRRVGLVLCGGNIDMTVLNKIIDRGLAADGRLCRLTCRTSDRPGSLARMTAVFARTGASVVEVFHDRHFGPADVANVAITAILETRDTDHIAEVLAALQADGFDVSPG